MDALQIYVFNVNGLRTKLPEFYANVMLMDLKIYMLCETNLDDSINDSEVFPNDYCVFRCDRSELTEKFQTTHKSSGGGVLIAIHT